MTETPRSKISRAIKDPVLVAEAAALMAAEQAACSGSCGRDGGPSHFGAYVRDGVLYQRLCESFNRVFDPALHAFVGRSHCSCDSCY